MSQPEVIRLMVLIRRSSLKEKKTWILCQGKGKAIPVQAWTGVSGGGGSKISKDSACKGGR